MEIVVVMQARQKGFTLIEMLVSIAIFSSLIGVLLMGFHQGLNLWEKGQRQGEKRISLQHRYEWLERVFSQAIASGYPFVGGGVRPFFLGDEMKMTLITAAPIMDTPGSLRPVQFQLLKKDEQLVLMYREGRKGSDVNMDISFESLPWAPLLQKLEKASFKYEAPANPFPEAGYLDSLPPVERKQYRDSPEWMPVFDSKLIRSLPSRVEFFFVDEEGGEHRWSFQCRYVPDIWPEEFYNYAL